MRQERSYRGWIAACTAAITLTLVLMTVEKYLALPGEDFWTLAKRVSAQVAGKETGIKLELDPELVGTSPFAPNQVTAINQRTRTESDTAGLLRRPPELASNAFLREPLSAEDFVSLPLSRRSSSLQALMEQMAAALESPLSTVSLQTTTVDESANELISHRFDSLRSPSELVGKMPAPDRLLSELDSLRVGISAATGNLQSAPSHAATHFVSKTTVSLSSANEVLNWTTSVQSEIQRLTNEIGLENSASASQLDRLLALSSQGRTLGEQLTEHEWAAELLRTSYSLERRVAVWSAMRECLDGTSIGLAQPNKGPQVSKPEIVQAIHDVQQFLANSNDREGWQNYLLLGSLEKWAASDAEQWRVGNQLARSYLSRVYWARLDSQQQEMLKDASVEHLAHSLSSWSRDPVDYRHLLTSIEQFEQDATSRQVIQIADTIQILRHAESRPQRQLAEVLNTHYRNANLRLTVSQSLIERFLPEGQYEVRPVRQRILGADTAGDSAMHTQLAVRFLPDPVAWNIELGIRGDMVSATQSSKGPAIFHSTGTAQVNSQRYLRMSAGGYDLSSQPAQVSSTNQLQRMSTDFDGLPVVGDFVRLMVREQFNQKRGLARRITERIIANETDAEIDRKLGENLANAERELNDRILGPLNRLSLDPMVVSMSTTEDRLAIRYRLAHELQLSANTPRPRAPTDCLSSFQIHQSVLNNTIDKIGLSGKTWRLRELYSSIGKVFKAQWDLPQDIPDDISIRFADHRPITVEMQDGKLRLQLRIANFQRDEGLSLNNFIVTSTYIPVADGLRAELVRDPEGTVEIQAKHLPVRDRIATRLIFTKVFVSQKEIPVISEEWSQDERAQGLAVSQLEIRDGWLAVAISESTHPLAAEVAERAREMKSLIR